MQDFNFLNNTIAMVAEHLHTVSISCVFKPRYNSIVIMIRQKPETFM